MERKKANCIPIVILGRSVYVNNNIEPGVLTITNYDIELYFTRYGLQGFTRDKLLEEIQEEFEATIESIEKYRGFYIGRYETGNLAQKEPVVQRMNTDIGSQDWYTGYTRLQTMGVNENVKSNIIFSCLWDETLQWLIDSENKTYEEIKNSISWGNYKDNSIEYFKTNGGVALTEENSNTLIPAGSAEITRANNIYDMAGNVLDWTLEANQYRTSRGGNTTYTCSVSERKAILGPASKYGSRGFRAYLYIK